MLPLITPPRRIVVAGDWHGNTPWALSIIHLLPTLLPDESPRLILHVGDFGIWPGPSGTRYLHRVNQALVDADAVLWFVDGNHEDFTQLYDLAGDPATIDPVPVHDRITWLPRGHRWTWHDRIWVAVGGAVSVDRVNRCEQIDWWSEEEITDQQARRVIAGGPADVMVCHDAPATVPLRLPPPASWWSDRDLARSQRHRERLQTIVDEVRPAHLLHGHYHLYHDQTVSMSHGPVRVTGLDCDEATSGNYRVLDVEFMEYELMIPRQRSAPGNHPPLRNVTAAPNRRVR